MCFFNMARQLADHMADLGFNVHPSRRRYGHISSEAQVDFVLAPNWSLTLSLTKQNYEPVWGRFGMNPMVLG